VFWLRWKVAGGRHLASAGVLAVLLGMNIAWLFGFTSFLLGATLLPITLGVWWSGREGGFSRGRVGALAALMVLGYFCHLVSLGLTALGLVVLESITPGVERRGRARATLLGFDPLDSAGMELSAFDDARWRRTCAGVGASGERLLGERLANAVDLGRSDLAGSKRDVALLGGVIAPWWAIFAPVLWLGVGLAIACWAGVGRISRGIGGGGGCWRRC